MIDRYLLRYFLAVVDQGNFSKAARQCEVSQPTLSVGIAKLESLVGHMLFRRTNRRVELTTAGATFSVHARRIEAEFTTALQAMQEDRARKLIRVGLISTIRADWIERATRAACEIEGEKLELVEGPMRDLLPRLERGRLDGAIGILGNDTHETELLFEEGYALAMSEAHAFSGREKVEPEQLVNEDMLVRRDCEALQDVSNFFTQRGVRPFFAARTTSEDRAIAYVKAGLGITVMPRSFARAGICMPLLSGFEQRRRVGLLTNASSAKRLEGSRSVQRFTRSLRESAGAALPATK
jgi:LysR family hydrogen peroxide-inducible transcriptional activator